MNELTHEVAQTNNAMDQMVQIVTIQREICGRIERAADSSGHG